MAIGRDAGSRARPRPVHAATCEVAADGQALARVSGPGGEAHRRAAMFHVLEAADARGKAPPPCAGAGDHGTVSSQPAVPTPNFATQRQGRQQARTPGLSVIGSSSSASPARIIAKGPAAQGSRDAHLPGPSTGRLTPASCWPPVARRFTRAGSRPSCMQQPPHQQPAAIPPPGTPHPAPFFRVRRPPQDRPRTDQLDLWAMPGRPLAAAASDDDDRQRRERWRKPSPCGGGTSLTAWTPLDEEHPRGVAAATWSTVANSPSCRRSTGRPGRRALAVLGAQSRSRPVQGACTADMLLSQNSAGQTPPGRNYQLYSSRLATLMPSQ